MTREEAIAQYRADLMKRNPGLVSGVNQLRAKLGQAISPTGEKVFGVSNNAVHAAPAISGGANALVEAIKGALGRQNQQGSLAPIPSATPGMSQPAPIPNAAPAHGGMRKLPAPQPQASAINAVPVNASNAQELSGGGLSSMLPAMPQMNWGALENAWEKIKQVSTPVSTTAATPDASFSDNTDWRKSGHSLGQGVIENMVPSSSRLPQLPTLKDLNSLLSYYSDSSRKARGEL